MTVSASVSFCLFLQKESGQQQVLNTRALLKSRSSACADYLSIQESNGQSVKGVSAGSTAIVWTFQTAFLVRRASRGNAQLARTPGHKRLFVVCRLPLFLLTTPYRLYINVL